MPLAIFDVYLRKFLRYFNWLLSVTLLSLQAQAQCSQKITNFPHIETFDNNDGSWIPGGSGSDWAYGTPSKSVINSAASGSDCWIVGGLTGTAYTNGELSWLQSPCYDFTGLKYPYLSFKIFWETEKLYDGAGLQYSVDNGSSWKDLGSVLSSKNCLNTNWYNTESVRYLNGLSHSLNGWSGSTRSGSGSCQTGGGSGKWVTATHVLDELKGSPSVIFRFVFGAGTTCNNFDGFAVDDFSVSEGPDNRAAFDYTCMGSSVVQFNNLSDYCPDSEWDFDDPLSGALNTSTEKNPKHTFISPGKHNVMLVVSSLYGKPDTIRSVITTLSVKASVLSSILCPEDSNGQLQATATGSAVINYIWNTEPVQLGNTAVGLTAGTYMVEASSNDACAATDTIQIAAPSKISHTLSYHNPGCTYSKGEAFVSITGGNAPYTYSWFPAGGNNALATGLDEGKYLVRITDNNQCKDSAEVNIITVYPPLIEIDTIVNVNCNAGNDGMARIKISGGQNPYTIQWNIPSLGNSQAISGLKAGDYIITVTDSNQCSSKKHISISEPPVVERRAELQNATCGFSNGKISIITAGNYTYQWIPAISSSSLADNIPPGTYNVRMTDSNGCNYEIKNMLLVNIGKPANPFLGKDTAFCTGEKIIVTPGPFETYLWQDGTSGEKYIIDKSGTYWVTVLNESNCKATDSIRVTILDHCVDLYFPDIFTPNNDGLNDTYGPVGNFNAVSNYKLIIYNRWGEMVFSSDDPRKKWDGFLNGKLIPNATYIWHAAYEFRNQGKKIKSGTLVLIR